MNRMLLSIGLVSLSLLAFQLSLMQVLSLMQWHHFASMVIALALLGFGASGTVLALVREWAQRHAEKLLPWSMIISGLLMPLSVAVAQVPPVRFDSLKVFADPQGLVGVTLTSLVFALPFFLGALAIGLMLARWPFRAPSLYFSNLLGSGIGTMVSLGLMWWIEPARLPALWGGCAVGAGILLSRSPPVRLTGAAALCLCGLMCVMPPELVLSEFKEAAAALRLPEARETYRAPSPEGLLQQISSPALRAAPGVSLTYAGVIPPCPVLYNNGDRVGPVYDPSDSTVAQLLRATTFALPYAIRSPRRVLIPNAGSGVLVVQALIGGATTISAVEPNERLVAFVRAWFDSARAHDRCGGELSWHALTSRIFLGRSPQDYDLINVPPVGAYGGGAGLSALREEYILTVESLRMMWGSLTPDGLLCLTAWMDYPPRTVLKLAGTIVAMASQDRVPLADHMAAVRGWGTVTFVVSRSPLEGSAVDSIRSFCLRHGFDPLVLRGLQPQERMVRHQLQDTTLFSALDALLRGDRDLVEANSPFRIAPAVDDRPYFYQFLRLDRLPALGRLFGTGALPYVEAGYAVVLLTGVAVLLLALMLITLPLLAGRTVREGRVLWALVFAGLGVGYMAAEIALIQRFVPLLGTTVSSAGIVIGSLLVSSGAGSLFSGRLTPGARTLFTRAGAVGVSLVILFLVLPWVLPLLLPLPAALRVVASVLVAAVPGFLMGMPFPLGLRLLAQHQPANIPWVWGINGACSVAGASIAPILAVELGMSAVLAAGAGAYAFVAIVAGTHALRAKPQTIPS